MPAISELNEERDADAALWGKALFGAVTIFKALHPGERFVFNHEDKDRAQYVLVKTAHGYRHEIGGRQWKTGARTAVFPLPPLVPAP